MITSSAFLFSGQNSSTSGIFVQPSASWDYPPCLDELWTTARALLLAATDRPSTQLLWFSFAFDYLVGVKISINFISWFYILLIEIKADPSLNPFLQMLEPVYRYILMVRNEASVTLNGFCRLDYYSDYFLIDYIGLYFRKPCSGLSFLSKSTPFSLGLIALMIKKRFCLVTFFFFPAQFINSNDTNLVRASKYRYMGCPEAIYAIRWDFVILFLVQQAVKLFLVVISSIPSMEWKCFFTN